MRVTLTYLEPSFGVGCRQVEIECDSTLLRDGVIIMITLDSKTGAKIERGVPLARLEEYEIRPDSVPPPRPGVSLSARATYVAPTNQEQAHAAGWHVGERKPGCPECQPVDGPVSIPAACPNCGSEDPATKLWTCDDPGGWHASSKPWPVEPGDPFSEMELTLNGWIEGQKANHEGDGHRGEPTDRQCWDWWRTDDVRRMIADARNNYKPGQ